jgi:putative tryptophan/tyrosine transport system substrate-binding protein
MASFSRKILWLAAVPILLIIILGFVYIFSPPREEPKRIGVLFYQNNPTTKKFLNGLKTGLVKQGYYEGKNLNLYVENMQNASSEATLAILKEIEQKRVDLLVTTGKDLTITTAHTILNKPIIYALVSRPITNETIKTVIDQERNITGVSYFTPYDRTLELGKRVIPHFKKLTLLLPEKSAWPDYNRLKEASDKVGVALSLKETPLTSLTDTILKLHGQTDAIYLPYDIQLIFENDLIKKALLNANLPAISNNLEYQTTCILTYFAEPETIGEIAGRMAVKIFHGAKLKYLPVELSSYYRLTVNLSLLKKLNIKIDEDLLSYANEVIQ